MLATKKMDWEKLIKKGLAGAFLGGGCAAGATQEAMSTVICALIGFVYRAGINWFKHK